MTTNTTRSDGRLKRKARIRKKVTGTLARPRLSVFRSANHMYAQVIDDTSGRTLVAASTVGIKIEGHGGNVASAKAVGVLIAERTRSAGIDAVVFDRNGFKYHGRVKALADAAREGGLNF